MTKPRRQPAPYKCQLVEAPLPPESDTTRRCQSCLTAISGGFSTHQSHAADGSFIAVDICTQCQTWLAESPQLNQHACQACGRTSRPVWAARRNIASYLCAECSGQALETTWQLFSGKFGLKGAELLTEVNRGIRNLKRKPLTQLTRRQALKAQAALRGGWQAVKLPNQPELYFKRLSIFPGSKEGGADHLSSVWADVTLELEPTTARVKALQQGQTIAVLQLRDIAQMVTTDATKRGPKYALMRVWGETVSTSYADGLAFTPEWVLWQMDQWSEPHVERGQRRNFPKF